jgi:hypothetical protein
LAKKRGRPPGSGRKAVSSESILQKLNAWWEQRTALAAELRAAADRLDSGENPFPWGTGGKARASSDGGMVSRGRKRKRRGMSSAQKKAVSARMKKYWAERRKTKGASK